ncbi:MAG: hypothetical protein H6702_24880, partial [Myxococcales bacterium]|nr:hypothetical protein [Myxococcales bacterium]
MTAPAAPDIQRLRAETTERLDFARRVLGADGALVAWQVAEPDAWLAGDDARQAQAQVAAVEADLASGRAGFDYGQRFLFAAGGRGAMLVRLAQAPALCAAVDTAFRANTGERGILATTYMPFDPDGSPAAEALALSRLRRDLAIARHEADPADALPPPPLPARAPRLVAAAALEPFARLDEACHRLIDHAVAHEALAALAAWALAQAPEVTPLGLGPDLALTAPLGAGLAAPATVAAALARGIH